MTINCVARLNKQDSQSYAQNLLKEVQNGKKESINSICSGIFDSTAGVLGTNEAFVEEIINNADAETITLIMDRYSEVTGSEIYKDIENDFSGEKEKELLTALGNAYKSVKDEEYTGWNDGQLNNKQIATSVGKGMLDKLPSIGLIAAGTATAPAIASAAGSALTAAVGASAAAAVATAAAPVLVVAGIVAAGHMIGKGLCETKEAIDKGKNSQDDNTTMDTVREGTNGVIQIAEGVYFANGAYNATCNSAEALSKFGNTSGGGGCMQPALAEGYFDESVAIAGEVESVIEAETEEAMMYGGSILFAKKGNKSAHSVPRVCKNSNPKIHSDMVDHVKNGAVVKNGKLDGRHVIEKWTNIPNTDKLQTSIGGHTFIATPKGYGIYEIRTANGDFVKIQGLATEAEYDHLLDLLDESNGGSGLTTNQAGCFKYSGKYWKLVDNVTLYPIDRQTAIKYNGGPFPTIN